MTNLFLPLFKHTHEIEENKEGEEEEERIRFWEKQDKETQPKCVEICYERTGNWIKYQIVFIVRVNFLSFLFGWIKVGWNNRAGKDIRTQQPESNYLQLHHSNWNWYPFPWIPTRTQTQFNFISCCFLFAQLQIIRHNGFVLTNQSKGIRKPLLKSNYIIVDGSLLCYCDTHPTFFFCPSRFSTSDDSTNNSPMVNQSNEGKKKTTSKS